VYHHGCNARLVLAYSAMLQFGFYSFWDHLSLFGWFPLLFVFVSSPFLRIFCSLYGVWKGAQRVEGALVTFRVERNEKQLAGQITCRLEKKNNSSSLKRG
jgi:hypothetical protein